MDEKRTQETTWQTLRLLKYICEHGGIHLDELGAALGVGDDKKKAKTRKRRLDTLKEFFEEEIGKEILIKESRDYYRAVNLDSMRALLNFADRKEIQSYIQIINEILPTYLNALDEKTRSDLKRHFSSSQKLYLFRTNSFEEFKDRKLLKKIEEAIIKKRRCTLKYKGVVYAECRPLRILFMEGNLYLATMTEDHEINGGFKFLRLSLLESFSMQSHEFHHTEMMAQAERFLETFQTPFARFDKSEFEVVLHVASEVAIHFIQKKHLPSQDIELLKDGSLRLYYYVTNSLEILPLVKKWIPHITILEPQWLKEEFEKMLKDYLDLTKPS